MTTVATQPTTLQDHLKTLEGILGNLKKIVPNGEQKGETCMLLRSSLKCLIRYFN